MIKRARINMVRKWIVIFLILTLTFTYALTVNAIVDNGLVRVENYKAACPGELALLNTNVINRNLYTDNLRVGHSWITSILWLSLDELSENQVYDQSSLGNHGSVKGATLTDGKNGKALSFDGLDDFMSIDNASFPVDDSLTISIFVRPLAKLPWDSYQGIVTKGLDWQTSNFLFRLEYGNPGGIQLIVSDGKTVDSVGYEPNFDGMSFYHLAATIEGKVYKIYENGVLKATNDQGSVKLAHSSQFPINIGQRGNGGPYFNGTIDETYLFGRALTDKEILWLYSQSWKEKMNRSMIALAPGENADLSLSITVPDNAEIGNYTFLLTVFSTISNYSKTSYFKIGVLPRYSSLLTLDSIKTEGKPGSTVNISGQLSNTGNIEDTYKVAGYNTQGWNLSISIDSITISADETINFTILLLIPSDRLTGDNAIIKVEARSYSNETGVAFAEAIVGVAPTYRFSMQADRNLIQTHPGSSNILSLELTNKGTANDTIKLTTENTLGWKVELALTSISLETDELQKVLVKVTIPEETLVGQKGKIIVFATSSGDQSLLANSTFQIEIVTPFWERADTVFAIGIVIGLFVGLTLTASVAIRYSRTLRLSNRWS